MIRKNGKWISWKEFFKEELELYDLDFSENEELLTALDEIMEELG